MADQYHFIPRLICEHPALAIQYREVLAKAAVKDDFTNIPFGGNLEEDLEVITYIARHPSNNAWTGFFDYHFVDYPRTHEEMVEEMNAYIKTINQHTPQ